MTLFDYVFLCLLALSVIVGLWRGLISEIFALVGWVVAFAVARYGAPLLAPTMAHWVETPWMAWAASFLAVFILTLLVLGVIRFLLRELLAVIGMSPIDRMLGACFGVVRAVFVAILVVAAAGLTQWPKEPWWRDSTLAPAFETAVIAAKPWMPHELAVRIKYR
ncbi:CvpA family protein [Uliginosibacterium sp. sgz301328]|uniref:CvpA family protein n=1 Tax=Uliginosibacterium sp. sgz301328 TaxID=3243764 RepID=UPI00359E0C24